MVRAPASGQRPLDVVLPRVSGAERARALALLSALRASYPDAHCELNHSSPHELLVATILSAQSTDVGVNKATPGLFAAYPTPAHYAASTPERIEPYIRTIGLYRNKAKMIHAAMTALVQRHAGQVPRTMDELTALAGVGRKTAGVVLGNCFGINDGVVVDTHVTRLSVRLGLAPAGAKVEAIEKRLMALFPREDWCLLSHLLIFHGRYACKARGSACVQHPVCEKFGTRCELRSGPNAKSQRAKVSKKQQS